MADQKISHAAAWGGLPAPAAPAPTRAKPARQAPRIRSDESIGRPEDIGKLVPPKAAAGTRPPDVRVTLNIPPDLYRQFRKWTDHAADELGAPQVSQQDALRAMITAITLDPSIGLVVIDLLRQEGS